MQELNLDVAGEFLVMAATLIHIKSRMLLPRPEPAQGDPDEEDPREALVRRLLEHQKFKAAAELLHERETLRSAQWTRPDGAVAEMAGEAPRAGARSRSVQPAVARSARASSAPSSGRKVLPAGGADPDRGAHRAADGAAVGDRSRAASRTCSPTSQTRAGLIVTFLAMLEMIRLKLIRVFQTGAARRRSASTSAPGRRCAAPDPRSRRRVQGTSSRGRTRRAAGRRRRDGMSEPEQPDTDVDLEPTDSPQAASAGDATRSRRPTAMPSR